MAASSDAEVSLSDPNVLAKYDQAAAVCNHVIAQIVSVSIPGARVFEICEFGDSAVTKALTQVFPDQKLAKGLAFPTSVSVNNIVANFSPGSDSKVALKAGDIVKVEVGAHVDGLIARMVHTFIPAAPLAEGEEAQPVAGLGADAICAAHFATEAALRCMRPGNKVSSLTSTIQKIAQMYGCNAVVDSFSYDLHRYVSEGSQQFAPRETRKATDDFEFEVGQAYALNVAISTGDGKPKESTEKPTIFRRDNDTKYSLKMKASVTTLAEIKRSYPSQPFNIRYLKDQKTARLGITEIAKHQLVFSYPVLQEKAGQFVAQFKNLVLILPAIGENPGRVAKLTAHALPFVTSEKSITDPEINALIAEPLTF